MSPMRRGPHGWESSLSAFRIEGSEQIDMVCMVSICPEKVCPESNVSYVKQNIIRNYMNAKNNQFV
uniref:ZP domain-containing protein n=1 Tax=Heterorhabditis bacteriophora TaxID=37862 RepID=A0A1I7X356_HETBA